MSRYKYTKKELLMLLRQWAQKHGETPSQSQWDADVSTPSSNPIRARFGSWAKGLRAAGFTVKGPTISKLCFERMVAAHKGKTSFATTLNRDITDPDSFFLALGIPQGKIKVLCPPSGENEFVKCDVTGTAVKGDLWYSQKLNAVIYGKEGFSLEPGLVEKVWEKIKNLFGVESELSQESIFVAEVQNFRDVYLLKKDEKFIRAVREVFSPQKQTLIAEYENFETPVCEYVTHVNLPEDLELLEEAAGQQQLSCIQQEAIQHVEAISNLDLLWPQLTGKVRVS